MPNTYPPYPPLLTSKDLARALGKSESYVHNALTHGRGIGTKIPPVVYIGNAPRWRPADVDEWLATRRIGAGAATPPQRGPGRPSLPEIAAGRRHTGRGR